jgi:HAD superfamily hydrolase (TIGR01459 family)
VPLELARYALCTGLRDDVAETLDDYETELRALAASTLPMICANPDIVIHRGETLIYCAGALAARFEAMGGDVVYAGKPHLPIYRRALALAEKARGAPVSDRRVMAVGDGMKTDIAGAARAGLDSLLVTRGIHRSALHGESFDSIADPGKLRRLCDEFSLCPTAAIASLEG